MMRTTSRRAGMTLIEIMISAVILSILALAMLTATTSLTRTTNVATIANDLDRNADRFLADLRRELRPSGYQKFGNAITPMFWGGGATNPGEQVQNGTSFRYKKRIKLEPFNATTTEASECWFPFAASNQWIEYARIVDPRQPTFGTGATKYVIVKRYFDSSTSATTQQDTVLENVREALFTYIPPGGGLDLRAQNNMALLEVNLSLASVSPIVTSVPYLTVRQYTERVRMQNAR